ncbi:MAG: hypothetical protein LUH47_07955 [Clostridiales bacterium]|nr:hypothetical protein [Clostridiales bacterium]
MKTIEEMLNKLAYLRLDEIPDRGEGQKCLNNFCRQLEGELKKELSDILDNIIYEQDGREKDIYINGLKDGFVLADYITRN